MAARLQMLTVLIAALLLASAPAPASAQKESRFKVCKKAQPPAKLNECVKESLQKAIPELVKGLPEFQLYSIDPLRVESLQVAKSNDPKKAVSVDISFKNLDVLGLRNAKITSADMDVDKYKLKAKLDIDGDITLVGDYTIKGKVLVLPIVGSGRCNITLVNPKGEITDMSGKPITRNGKQYVQVTALKFIVTSVDRCHYKLDNLFDGNKELGDNVNAVLNDNWRVIYEDMKAPLETALGIAYRNIASRVFEKVEWRKVFP